MHLAFYDFRHNNAHAALCVIPYYISGNFHFKNFTGRGSIREHNYIVYGSH